MLAHARVSGRNRLSADATACLLEHEAEGLGSGETHFGGYDGEEGGDACEGGAVEGCSQVEDGWGA